MRHYLSKSRLDTQFKDVLGMRRKPKQLEKVFSGTRLRCTGKHNIYLSSPAYPVCVLRKREQDIENTPDDHSDIGRCEAPMLM